MNTIIPVINCGNEIDALKRIEEIHEFHGVWAHIDVSDGVFSNSESWHVPDTLLPLLKKYAISLEVHCMVANPKEEAIRWISFGAKRILIHTNAFSDISEIKTYADIHEAEIGIAIDSEENIEKVLEVAKEFKINFFQILAVHPGPAGQVFHESALSRISYFRGIFPDARIELDGGVNPEVIKKAKEAGVDVFVSASYIFSSENSQKAFSELQEA